MDIKFDRSSKQPIYSQIYFAIVNKIRNGEYPYGIKLPSERELAKKLNVNRSTANKIYEELLANGFVEKKRGVGTFVGQNISPIILNTNWNNYVHSGTLLPTNKKIIDIRNRPIGKNLFDFSQTELSSDLCPTVLLLQTLSNFSKPIEMNASHPLGLEELREQLVKHMKKYYDLHTSKESIMITSGSQQAIYLIIQSLLQSGDAIAIESPSYFGTQHFFKSANVKTYYLNMDEEGVIPDDIESLHKKHRIKMLFLNPTYQNPTGKTYSLKRREEIVRVAEKLGIPIVEGDPFSLLNFEGEVLKPLKYFDSTGNVIYIGSFSKILGSGLRIGWIIGPTVVIERIADAKYQIDFGLSLFPQLICSEFIRSDAFCSHVNSLRNELLRRRNSLVYALNKYLKGEFVFSIPSGGLNLFGHFKDESITLANMQHANFSVAMGNLYGAPDNFARFSFTKLNEEDILKGIKMISNYLDL